MTDVTVSTARRIGFTALALVSFWVLAWRAYCFGSDVRFDGALFAFQKGYFSEEHLVLEVLCWVVGAPSSALISGLILSLSTHNSPWTALRDGWVWSSMMCVAVSIAVSFRLGGRGIGPMVESWWDGLTATQQQSLASDRTLVDHYLNTDDFSWPWLLLPLILTTAFVICGAWRRAVGERKFEPELHESRRRSCETRGAMTNTEVGTKRLAWFEVAVLFAAILSNLNALLAPSVFGVSAVIMSIFISLVIGCLSLVFLLRGRLGLGLCTLVLASTGPVVCFLVAAITAPPWP